VRVRPRDPLKSVIRPCHRLGERGETTVQKLYQFFAGQRISRPWIAICAYCVVLDGPVLSPLFEKLERDLAAMRQNQDTVERAKRLLESYGGMTARRAIEPPDSIA
jgi:hypothetical protein